MKIIVAIIIFFITITNYTHAQITYEGDDSLKNRTYTNKEIGWTMPIPDDWHQEMINKNLNIKNLKQVDTSESRMKLLENIKLDIMVLYTYSILAEFTAYYLINKNKNKEEWERIVYGGIYANPSMNKEKVDMIDTVINQDTINSTIYNHLYRAYYSNTAVLIKYYDVFYLKSPKNLIIIAIITNNNNDRNIMLNAFRKSIFKKD